MKHSAPAAGASMRGSRPTRREPSLRPMKKPTAIRLRRHYQNTGHPLVLLRFEDGHEITLRKGQGKAFDAYEGETVKIVAIYDPTSGERHLLASRKAEEFDPA
jgi:hypothetical protein